jgi:hypothetical protein
MRKEKITRYEITKANQRMIRTLIHSAVTPHLDPNNPEEGKMFNTLLQERYIFEDKMKGILNYLAIVKERIKAKSNEIYNWANDPTNPLPETSEGLLARPKEYAKMAQENYGQQLRFIDEIIVALTEEDEFDPDEDVT